MCRVCSAFLLLFAMMNCCEAAVPKVTLTGEVVDAQSGALIPARVYVRADDGEWLFVRSASDAGSAVEYRKDHLPGSVEMHTTISAHPFRVDLKRADLPPGRFTIRIERGKEYVPVEETVEIGQQPVQMKFRLQRWVDMAAAGWYSGDTHVHRTVEELPNVMRAEDLNVALPLSYWVTTAYTPPGSGDRNTPQDVSPEPIYIDPTRVIYPVNTEYEIFTVDGKQHTLGAVFALGHKRAFEVGAPPVRRIAEQAHRQGALLDLDKHSWPWSLMLVPVMRVDLFELANNHIWRAPFFFREWTTDTIPSYMNIETDANGFTERGWIDFGFETYYTLLNCGFRLRPTAGTASGVHPVPLGFGRVYVHLPDGFSYEKWMQGLDAGRSFVTTGPMLMVEVDGRPPGTTIRTNSEAASCKIQGKAISARPLRSIEVVVNGRVVKQIEPTNRKRAPAGFENPLAAEIDLDGSSWVAVRVFEGHPGGRVRFAHSSPVHIDIPGKPLRPRRQEVDYLIGRMEEELDRNRDVLREEELQEYRDALEVFKNIAKTAR